MNFFKSFGVMLLVKLVNEWLFPKLEELAKNSANKIDDVLVSPDVIDQCKKVIELAIKLITGEKKLEDLKAE